MVAGGTSLIMTNRGHSDPEFVEIGSTLTFTVHWQSTPKAVSIGAVNVTDACPLLPVVTLRAESMPVSTIAPVVSSSVSTRISTLAAGCPLGSRATMLMTDCDAPLAAMRSGVAVIASDSPSSDGPVRSGAF